MSIWFKCDARFHKDPKILKLPNDTARFAFLMIIGEAKYVRSGGMFDDRQHLEACLPTQYHDSIDALIDAGLLVRRGKKIAIKAWSQWQVDPTSAERSRRARQRVNNGTTTATQRVRVIEIDESDKERENLYIKPRIKINSQPTSVGQILRRAGNAE